MRISDWSSDVCSSDLHTGDLHNAFHLRALEYATHRLASGDARIILEPDRMRSAAPGERHRRLMLAGHHDLGFRGRRPLHVLVLFEMETVGSENAENLLQIGGESCRERARQYGEISVVA